MELNNDGVEAAAHKIILNQGNSWDDTEDRKLALEDATSAVTEYLLEAGHSDGKFIVLRINGGHFLTDEPVFVFRAQDACLVPLLERYWEACSMAGSPQGHLDAIEAHRQKIIGWQAEHGTKVPD